MTGEVVLVGGVLSVLFLTRFVRRGQAKQQQRLVPADRVRRGRGFNIVEAANLASWGIKLRPEELDPPTEDRRDPCEIAENLHANIAQAQRDKLMAASLIGPNAAKFPRWWDQKRRVWRDEETGRKVDG